MEVIKMKRSLGLGGIIIFMSMTLAGCGGGGNSSKEESNTSSDETTTVETTTDESTTDESTTDESTDTTDYGRAYFKSIYIYADAYGNNFDGVLIRPTFTQPEACKNEVFEYEIKDDSICYIEDDHVYATGVSGSTKVTAKSQHLKGTFIVYSESKYANGSAFTTAKSLANKAEKATNQGTTLFVGDSFFEFWRNKTGIDESFATAFNGYDVANVGISGTQAREWRSLVRRLIDPYQPENVVLNIGINDVDDNNEDGESTSEYIMNLCLDIWENNPECNIYYCSITRCAGYFASKWQFHSQSNEFMKTNCNNNEQLHYLDIMERWGDNFANYEQSDGLHPNTAGYQIIKEVIMENVPLKAL